MKLGSLKSHSGNRDGELIVVSRDNSEGVRAGSIAVSLREAIERWEEVRPRLQELYEGLNAGTVAGAFPVKDQDLLSPLPRAFQWIDGSAYMHHVKLVRQARGAEVPESLYATPLIYQGGSDGFLGPTEDIPQIDFNHGTDFEGEVAVVVNDVPMGVDPEGALDHILLFMIANDVSLRGLIPDELERGFGFFQGKPASSFAPFAITPEELGSAWRHGRVFLPLLVHFNNQFFGNADAGAMHFHFGQLIAHAARTRRLAAGTIIGSGTVSNDDLSRGSSCLAEKRMLEKIQEGVIKTPFMREGDTVEMKMVDPDGRNLFGTIRQMVRAVKVPF